MNVLRDIKTLGQSKELNEKDTYVVDKYLFTLHISLSIRTQ